MTQAGLPPTHPVTAMDELRDTREVRVAGEFPLTLYVGGREIVTLMTLGAHPEALALGYLRTQRFITALEKVRSVQVTWDTEAVEVATWNGVEGWDDKLKRRTVTTGCGQGTVFSCTLDSLYDIRLPDVRVRQSLIYGVLENIRRHNEVYRRAGTVHGCALCRGAEVLRFVEDVGRHNAVGTITGYMWLDHMAGGDMLFYTTGRLTSEIVMKVAQIGIPVPLVPVRRHSHGPGARPGARGYHGRAGQGQTLPSLQWRPQHPLRLPTAAAVGHRSLGQMLPTTDNLERAESSRKSWSQMNANGRK